MDTCCDKVGRAQFLTFPVAYFGSVLAGFKQIGPHLSVTVTPYCRRCTPMTTSRAR